MDTLKFRKAIDKIGSIRKTAHALGISSPRLHYWLNTNKIPAEYVLKAEEVTGIPRHELRPDIFPAQ